MCSKVVSARSLTLDCSIAALAPIPIALTVLAFVLGYQARAVLSPVVVNAPPSGSRGVSSSAKANGKAKRSTSPVQAPPSPSHSDGATDSDSDADDEAAANAADLKALRPGGDEIKLVLVVNDSLKMTKGKIGAQCGHATLACYETLARSNPAVGASSSLPDHTR